MAMVLGSCARAEPARPRPLVAPRTTSDVAGIWRARGGTVLELRANHGYVVISPITRPMTGRYTLEGDRMVFAGAEACADAEGSYRVLVDPHMRLRLEQPADGCARRREILSAGTWVYTPRGGG